MICIDNINQIEQSIQLSEIRVENHQDHSTLRVTIEHVHTTGDYYANNFDHLREDMDLVLREEIKEFMRINCQKVFDERNLSKAEIYHELNTIFYERSYTI